MAIDFQHDYAELELEERANWAMAQINYRRLVNHWHPDRYVQRPRERVHAQQQFIELTISFNNLRTFYRQNKRLPFERITVKKAASSSTPSQQQQVNPAEADILDSSIINNRKTATRRAVVSKSAKSAYWMLPIAFLLMCTLGLFVVMDRNAKKKSIEEAKAVLREVVPSAYMPNNEDINKQNARGAMIGGQGNGKLGDKLMQDIFK